jgi:hypothetical protein
MFLASRDNESGGAPELTAGRHHTGTGAGSLRKVNQVRRGNRLLAQILSDSLCVSFGIGQSASGSLTGHSEKSTQEKV